MNKILKYGLLGMAAAISIAVAGVVYVALTFNPNDYKVQIIQAVKDSKQRNLHLDGDIKLSFYPNIGVSLSNMSLSEFKSDQEFAAIASARVSLALLPLLRKQLVVDEVAVSGLKANLVVHKDGTTNIDDLLGQREQNQQEQKTSVGPPVKFDIASVSVENTNLNYLDEGSSAKYAIKDLKLKTGRIAVGVPSKIDFSTGIQANQPKLDITAQLKTTLTFDLDKQKYQLQDLELQAGGTILDIGKLNVTASGDVSADMASQEFTANKFFMNASGEKTGDKFEAILNAPSLSFTKDKYSAASLTLNAHLDGDFGSIVASLSMPGVEGNAQAFKVSELKLDLDAKQPEQAFKVKLGSPLSGNIKAQQFNLSNLSVAVTATGDKLPNKSVSSEMKGSVQVDALQQSVRANLAGGLLQSQLKANVAVNDFDYPAIKFDVELDQLDADLYLPKASAAATAPKSKQPEQPLDLSALRKLNLDGSLRIGTLKAMNVKSTQLRVDVKGRGGVVKVDPFSANLYKGSIASKVTLNVARDQPEFAVNAKLNGIEIGPLLNDTLKMDFLSGKGGVALNLATQGKLVSLLKRKLNGTMSLNLADGAVKGINLAKSVREFGKGGDRTQAANTEEKTDFSEMKASFKIIDGVAHNEDLLLKSPFIRVGGQGDIDLGNDSLDYLVKATITSTTEGQGGKDNAGGLTVPVRLNGPFTELKYKLEFGSMVSDAAKQKVSAAAEAAKQRAQQTVDAQKEQAKARVQEELKKGLKGLFK